MFVLILLHKKMEKFCFCPGLDQLDLSSVASRKQQSRTQGVHDKIREEMDTPHPHVK